jgi:hypothetical protein
VEKFPSRISEIEERGAILVHDKPTIIRNPERTVCFPGMLSGIRED